MSATAMQTPQQSITFRRFRPAVLAAALLALAAPAQAQQMAMLSAFPVLSAMRAPSRDATAELRARNLLIPVQGIHRSQLHDTFRDARSGGREHDAIDIHAPLGTPVLATTDGVIIKLHQGARGGNSLYQLDDDGHTRYYYAHLSRYAEGMGEGVRVHRGDVIGYVGDTGNAQPGDYHLHFSIAILHDRARWWTGDNLNPFDILHAEQ